MRVHPKLQAFKQKVQVPVDRTPHSRANQVRHLQRFSVCAVGAPCGHAGMVEPRIDDRDLVSGVVPGNCQFPARISAVAGELNAPRGGSRLAQDRTNVLEIEIAAITEAKSRVAEAGYAELRVNRGVRQVQKHLRDGEGVWV